MQLHQTFSGVRKFEHVIPNSSFSIETMESLELFVTLPVIHSRVTLSLNFSFKLKTYFIRAYSYGKGLMFSVECINLRRVFCLQINENCRSLGELKFEFFETPCSTKITELRARATTG